MSAVSLIVGGTSGIGAAVGRKMRLDGKLLSVVDEKHCDVRSAYQIERHLQQIHGDGDYVSELVYCAGINELEWIGMLDGGNQEYDRVMDIFDVNVIGFIRVMDSIVATWGKEQNPVNVVAISSDAGTRPLRTSIAYCSSKAALNMAVQVAARELGPFGWKVNAVAPGMVDNTEMTAQMDYQIPAIREWTLTEARDYERSQEVVPGRIDPKDVADLVTATLAGSGHLNGSILTINGGR